MGEFDTDYKLFYRPLVDFGKGVGINESMEKFNLEEEIVNKFRWKTLVCQMMKI